MTDTQDLAGGSPLISPVLERAEMAEDWYVSSSHTSSDGSSLQVFVWPPGTGTRVHDHSSWGAFRCVTGSVLEVRYARLDDGSKIEHARLREIWRRLWSREIGLRPSCPTREAFTGCAIRARKRRSPFTSTVPRQER
jgi:hypothetical protein